MTEFVIADIIIWYDGPQVVYGCSDGHHYIGVAVPDDNDDWPFLVAEVSKETVEGLRKGQIDLRDIYTSGSNLHVGCLFNGDSPFSDPVEYDPICLKPLEGEPPENWLPEKGCFLDI